jgi:hypothetical protein
VPGKEQRLDETSGLGSTGGEGASALDGDLAALAAEAFVYGFPLVFDLQEVDRFAQEGMGSVPAAAFNSFGHATQLAGPEDRFVSINNDTVYSIAQVDVSGGPVHLDVPDAAGRYYVLQFVDAWTNNFAYVGHRATGTESGVYLLVAPDWDGQAPSGETVIRFPTAVASIVGRWAVDGEDDMAAVRGLQEQLTLTPTGPESGAGMPMPATSVGEDLRFFERLRVWMRAFPPAARDLEYQRRFAPLGLFELSSPFADPNPELGAALVEGLAAGRKQMESALTHGASPEVNGWKLTYHAFDYNLDFFEVGTLDEPRWKIADPKLRYVERALAARGGLWGNHGYEAAYAMVYLDGGGETLDGSHRYELRFPAPPPVGAFWSVTMYDVPDFYLVANPIERYSVGDRSPGLSCAADGSLTIAMQHDEPEAPEARANWLPTPAGAFRPLLRMYEPKDAVFDGGYELPPIRRTG